MPKLSLEELAARANRGEFETVIVAAANLQGRLFGKRMPVAYFLEEGKKGVACTVANITWDIAKNLDLEPYPIGGWHTGFHDIVLVPDLATLRPFPWNEKTAIVLADISDEEGRLVPVAPRSVLRRQLEKARSMGFEVCTASELEFFIFRETPDSAHAKGFTNLEPLFKTIGDYDIYRTSIDEWFFGPLRRNLNLADIPVEAQKGEWGYGQMEINLRYSEALEQADRHTLYKEAVKIAAAQQGLLATFMAKWSDDSGNGLHVHISLWRDGQNVFYDPNGQYGLSDLGRHFLGGLMHLVKDLFLFTAPNPNSYKRYVYKSFAPTNNTWGWDNRNVCFRLAGSHSSKRIEYRAPGADANPYLVMAAMLGAGLYGIEHRLEPIGEPVVMANAYDKADAEPLPKNLVEAIEYFATSRAAKQILGPEVVEHYLVMARNELAEYFRHVTDWERKRYLELI